MTNALVTCLFVEWKLFSGVQVPSTDLYISEVRTPGKWALHLKGIC